MGIPWWWSFLLTSVGVFGLFIVGNSKWWGFAIGLFAQTLWLAYALATHQYGFLLSAFAYGWVNVRGWRNFRRNDKEKADAQTGT